MTPLDALLARLSGLGDGLALGTGRSIVTAGLRATGTAVEAVTGNWPSIQLPRRYPLVIVEPAEGVWDVAAIVHCATQHLDPAGHVVLMVEGGAPDRFELEVLDRVAVEGTEITLCRRTDRVTIHDTVFAARSRIRRVSPQDLVDRLQRPDSPVVIDTRTPTDRSRFGVIEGSIHVPRTVVEWHLDPANGYRHPAVSSFAQPLVLVCNGGYSSSLAAASLLDLGFTDVADLIGGIRAWIDAGFAVVDPDHSHLDL
ncbi:MAG TPA: rhodanese-like domain-containing protein [Ilumatobacteraceae bacterium]|nr:rhodanese-like domain-containing protein [Ilumatobacteraceae bacterium]